MSESVSGAWTISINAPQGAQRLVVDLLQQNGSVTGSARAMGNTVEITEGTFGYGRLTFGVRVSRPVPMRLRFDVMVDGDELSGHVVAWAFGKQPVTGGRKL